VDGWGLRPATRNRVAGQIRQIDSDTDSNFICVYLRDLRFLRGRVGGRIRHLVFEIWYPGTGWAVGIEN
jgi:hypothetical protein